MATPTVARFPEAVFLDRDGTLIEDRHYLSDPAGVAILPGVPEALGRLAEAGTRLFLFTNQSGVGRGYFTLADVAAVNRRMIDLLGLGPEPFTAVCIAPERPDEPPLYRKPSPRFITEMLARHALDPTRSWMIGDAPSDWEAGLAAGIRVAAIVADARADRHRERRDKLGVTAHAGLADWLQSVISGRVTAG